MADAGENLFPVAVTFSDGEQPTAAKLAGWAAQTRAGFKKLQYLVGDLWGTGGRPSSDTSKQGALFPSWAKEDISNRGPATVSGGVNDVTGTLYYRDPQIVNLARLIGPASALNPRIPSNTTATRTNEVVESGVNVSRLRSRPASYDGQFELGAASGAFSDGTVFATEVSSASAISAAGEFHIAQDGTITTYTTMNAGTVSYDYFTGDGDTYPDASHNVIPDPNQTSNGGAACTVAFDVDSSSTRLKVTLPFITHAQSNFDGTTSVLNGAADAGRDVALLLPEVLSGYTVEDQIPDGFLYLYDNVDKVALRDGVYRFGSYGDSSTPSTFFVEGLEEVEDVISDSGTNTSRYSVITVGANITQSLDHARFRLMKHQHTGLDGSEVINHSNLFNRFGEVDSALAALDEYNGTSAGTGPYKRNFTESEIPDNDHPIYLHRHGYRGGGTDGVYANRDVSNINRRNAMLGDLVMAPISGSVDVGYTWESDDSWGALTGDSHSIFFGNAPTSGGGDTDDRTRVFFDSRISTSGSIDTEGSSTGIYTVTLSTTNDDDRGLNIQRGNLFFGVDDDGVTTSTAVNDGSNVETSPNYGIGFRASEYALVTHGTLLSGITDSEKYKIGIRNKATYGTSIYLTTKNVGVIPYGTSRNDPAHGDQDQLGSTGSIILEASTSDIGLQSRANYGGEGSTWYGETLHGAGLIISSGDGAKSRLFATSGNSAGLGGLARWEPTDTVDVNRGAWVHIVAGADYQSIKEFNSDSDDISFQGDDSSPYGRICLDSDRGIDLVVRTQKYLHESEFETQQGQTNVGGGSHMTTTLGGFTIVGVDGDGNLPEVRLVADTKYSTLAAQSDSQMGANINLFYKHGKAYDRHNVSFTDPVDGYPEAGSPTKQATWGWRGGRNYQLFGIDADDYGSNVLGAGLVEAFRGIRTDPNQPPIHTYFFPFSYVADVTEATTGAKNTSGKSTNGTLTGNIWEDWYTIVNPYDSTNFSMFNTTFYGSDGATHGYTAEWPADDDGNYLTWDQIIRWHDNRLATLLGMANDQAIFGMSLLSSSLLLRNWAYDHGGTPSSSIMDYSDGSRAVSPIMDYDNGSGSQAPWIGPASCSTPYFISPAATVAVAGTSQEEDGTVISSLENRRVIYQKQNVTAPYYTYDLSLVSTSGNSPITNVQTEFPKLERDIYNNATAGNFSAASLLLRFGSNPYNAWSYFLPYHTAPADPAVSGSFKATIHGRLMLKIVGDAPYRLMSGKTGTP